MKMQLDGLLLGMLHSDTVVAIIGSITEVLWGIQQEIYFRIFDYLDTEPIQEPIQEHCTYRQIICFDVSEIPNLGGRKICYREFPSVERIKGC